MPTTGANDTGGMDVCMSVASRTMFNSGRFLWRAKSKRIIEARRSAGPVWSKRMRPAGYQTYFTGKLAALLVSSMFKSTCTVCSTKSLSHNRPQARSLCYVGWLWDKLKVLSSQLGNIFGFLFVVIGLAFVVDKRAT